MDKFYVKNFILHAVFQSAQHLYEKRKGSGSVPLTNGSGWLKNMRILLFRIPNTAWRANVLAQSSADRFGE
jgi:hypothetical protein